MGWNVCTDSLFTGNPAWRLPRSPSCEEAENDLHGAKYQTGVM